MAPSRARSTTAHPSASHRLAVRPEATGILARQMRKELPNYDVPQYPISLASQRKLDVLAQKYKRRNLADKHAKALKQLGECIHDLQQELGNMEDVVEKQKRKDEKGVEDANVELWQDKLNAFKPKHHNLAKRLEKSARTCVDLTQRHDAVVRAAEQSAHAAAVSQTQRPRAARNTQDGDMSSFEPTLPGATGEAGEGDTTMAEVESTLETFKKRRRDQVEAWTSLSLLARYGQHRGYVDFREQEHEGYYGDEQDAPPSTQWFAEEEPAPGTTTQGAAEESDDDIQVARSKISTKCPLTLKEFEDPVMSTACRHTFEKSAIYELLGRRPQTQCPVGGCPNHITRSQLEPNDKLIRKIRRIQQSRNRVREDIDDENHTHRGTNANTSIMLSDGPDFNLKGEARPQSQRLPRSSAANEDVTDDDTDDE